MSAVEDAVRKQISIQKRRNNSPTIDPNDNEQSPEEDIKQNDLVNVQNVPPGKAFGPGAVEGPVSPEQGSLARLGSGDIAPKPLEPRVQGRKSHPDPLIEDSLRAISALDTYDAKHQAEIDKLSQIEYRNDKEHAALLHHSERLESNRRAKEQILRGVPELAKAYYDKEEQQPPSDEGPGFFSGIGNAISKGGSILKNMVEHPQATITHGIHGASELATLPIGVLEGALGRGDKGFYARGVAGHKAGEEALRQGPGGGFEQGSPEDVVSKGVGGALLPIPGAGPLKALQLAKGETLKNVMKMGGLSAGITQGESIAANKGLASPEETGVSFGIGGTLGGVLGRFFGKQRAAAVGKAEGSAGATGTPDMPPGSGPVESPILALTNQQKQIGSREGGTIYGEAPYKQLPPTPQAEGEIPGGAVEIPVSGYLKKFTKVWRTPEGDLIGETRGGEIIRADKQPTPLSLPPEGGHERSTIERLVAARKLQERTTAAQPSGAPEQQPVPEQPFSGQPQPRVNLQAAPLPGAQPTAAQAPSALQRIIPQAPQATPQPAQPAPQMRPAAQAQPQAVAQARPEVMGAPQPGAPPLKVVNPTPQAQQNVSELQKLLGRGEQPQPQVQPQPKATPEQILVHNQAIWDQSAKASEMKGMKPSSPRPTAPQPEETSAKVGTTAEKSAGKNVDMVKWARREGYTVREFAGTNKVEIRDPNTGEKIVEFGDTPSRNKAAAHLQKQIDTDEKNTIKLWKSVV